MKHHVIGISIIAIILVLMQASPVLAFEAYPPFVYSKVDVNKQAYASVNLNTGYIYEKVYPGDAGKWAMAIMGGAEWIGIKGVTYTMTFNGVLNAFMVGSGLFMYPVVSTVAVDLMWLDATYHSVLTWKEVYCVNLAYGQTEVDHTFYLGEFTISWKCTDWSSLIPAVRLRVSTASTAGAIYQSSGNTNPAYLSVNCFS